MTEDILDYEGLESGLGNELKKKVLKDAKGNEKIAREKISEQQGAGM